MNHIEDLNWKLKEAALLENKTPADCELEGATLNVTSPGGNNPGGSVDKPTPLSIAQVSRVRHNPYNSDNYRDVGWQDDPDPTMPSLNPFTQARNISFKKQSDIATALGLEVVDIIRLEQGILTKVPNEISRYYTSQLGMPIGWEAGYKMFQKALRRSAPRPVYGVWRTPPGEFSFRRFRTFNWPTLSQVGWCKAFCVHPSSLYAIEKNAKQVLPHDILTSLIEANVMSEEQARQFAFRIRQAASNQRAHDGAE